MYGDKRQNSKNSSGKRKIEIGTVIGIIASLITILIFVSGKDHLPDFFQKDRAVIASKSFRKIVD